MKNTAQREKETNRDYALRVIRENIISLGLKPGSLISEQDIANELGLSRTPVHEAMQELAQTKIITVLPQRGILISLIDMRLVDEAVFMRSTIEAAVTTEACKTASAVQIQQLEENLNLQEFYQQKGNVDKIMELDNAFHETMYTITGKTLCYYMIKTMNIHMDRVRSLHLHSTDPAKVIEEHRKILRHFSEHSQEGLREKVEKHLTRLYLDEQEIRKKYPDYFV